MRRRFLSLCLAALMMLSSSAVAADGYTVPVKLTADAPTLNVTLPTSIPISLGSNGIVTCLAT